MIQVVYADQYWDFSRTSFFVGVQNDGRRAHSNEPVYKDAFGRRFVIRERP